MAWLHFLCLIIGAKHLKLKAMLQEQMAKNRAEARKQRTQVEQFDNEEGFEGKTAL